MSGSARNRTEPYSKELVAMAQPWGLTVLQSPDPDLCERELRLQGRLTCGREAGDGVELVVTDRRMSRRHATISGEPGAWTVTDHDTTNGTFVNGAQISEVMLHERSLIRVGDTLLELGILEKDPGAGEDPGFLGRSGPLKRLLAAIDHVAETELGVLITGETGVGKELVARRIHRQSGRRGELVVINCGAIPDQLMEAQLFGHTKGAYTGADSASEGLLGRARGGSLFFDEVGELPLGLQPKLLRVIENREYLPVGDTRTRSFDGRFIAATNLDLPGAIRDKTFRADLFARLDEFSLRVPPLRERRRDVPLLVRAFVKRFAPQRELSLSARMVESLWLHDWPMNVRELQNLMKRAVINVGTGTTVSRDHLGDWAGARAESPSSPSRGEGAGDPGREELARQLARLRGNVAEVARHFGKPRSQLYRWLKRHALDAGDFRDSD